MTPDRLDDLFARYWDNALTADEAARFTRLLRDDPAARIGFERLCVQAAEVADGSGGPAPAGPRPWTRRGVLGMAGAAAGLAAAVGFVLDPGGRRRAGVVLTRVVGRVAVRSEAARLGALLRPGDTLAVEGVGSAAMLKYPDGSEVELSGDTIATLDAEGGPRLTVHQGGVSADLPGPGPDALTLATREATAVTAAGRAWLTLGRFGRRTEVGVLSGRVQLSRPEGQPPVEVAGGEVGTATSSGVRKDRRPVLPTEYAWDLTRPLPADWGNGRLVQTTDGPVAEAAFWPGGKHGRPAFQVISHNAWTNGFVAVHPDSVVRVRYRVARAGTVQSYFVVRPDPRAGSAAMVPNEVRRPECNRPGVWHTVEGRAGEMAVAIDPGVSEFPPPWVAFVFGVNTYDQDLGLQVAEFRISPPGDGG